jgi:hypothetical protein
VQVLLAARAQVWQQAWQLVHHRGGRGQQAWLLVVALRS